MTEAVETARRIPVQKHHVRIALLCIAIALGAAWLFAAFTLLVLRFVDPPTTMLQTERRIDAAFQHKPYHKQYEFVPLSQISLSLQHAVVAAEDARFYQHHGFDWHEIQIAADEDLAGKRERGASTLTQQLVKNLFFGTSRSFVRKGAEATLVPVAELVLGKQRILELYLNVVEWGPGVYGAEAACRTWDNTSAARAGREQAAELAAILPAPLKRKPSRMGHYTGLILERERQMGW